MVFQLDGSKCEKHVSSYYAAQVRRQALRGSVVQNLPAPVGDTRSILGSGRAPGEKWPHTPVLLWEVPWAEGLVGCSPRGHKKESDIVS